MKKHPVEAKDSWSLFVERANGRDEAVDLDSFVSKAENSSIAGRKLHRRRHKHKKHKHIDSGIRKETVHGMMIDAGSTGTRIHVYEFDRRTLSDKHEVEAALSGRLLTFPTADSRWTDRLKPGLSAFADLPDEELLPAVAEYMMPLMHFAKEVLWIKQDQFSTFPIFLKATGGMRILTPTNRARVMNVVRELFYNNTYCPFWFEDERARVISGEEEAIYDWTGVNFLMGTLIRDSEGAGTVLNPRLSYGALDLGGASTQISFYEPNGDIMANLFKLQIGPGRHWNVYCHSFLYYGIVEATNRLGARLANGKTTLERNVDGIYNPCLPGGTRKTVRTNIVLNPNGIETLDHTAVNSTDEGYYTVLLKNDGPIGDFDGCMDIAHQLLHLEKNDWCNFSHGGDCSFAGIYQPDLPVQSEHFGEFVAFSNFVHIWDFLELPSRANMDELKNQAKAICSMNETEFMQFNNGRLSEDDDVIDYCFRAVYIYQLLHNGFGFKDKEYVTALDVIGGLKVGWALGSMLYEINTLPWQYGSKEKHSSKKKIRFLPTMSSSGNSFGGEVANGTIAAVAVASLFFFLALWRSRRGRRAMYEPVANISL